MSGLKYGLNIPVTKTKNKSLPLSKNLLNAEDNYEDDSLAQNVPIGEKRSTKSSSSSGSGPKLPRVESMFLSSSTRLSEELKRKALQEDPHIFEYDKSPSIDTNKTEKAKNNDRFPSKEMNLDLSLDKSVEKKKPKYMDEIIRKAEARKAEYERILERKIQKERENEGDMFEDKDKFITASYKKKLEERRLLEEQQKKKEDLEKKPQNLEEFYRNIINRTIK